MLLFNKTRKMERKRVEDIKEEWKEGRKEGENAQEHKFVAANAV